MIRSKRESYTSLKGGGNYRRGKGRGRAKTRIEYNRAKNDKSQSLVSKVCKVPKRKDKRKETTKRNKQGATRVEEQKERPRSDRYDLEPPKENEEVKKKRLCFHP